MLCMHILVYIERGRAKTAYLYSVIAELMMISCEHGCTPEALGNTSNQWNVGTD